MNPALSAEIADVPNRRNPEGDRHDPKEGAIDGPDIPHCFCRFQLSLCADSLR
jgi:hypothetical protein